ncbi:MAG: hypothetical protein HN855_09985 [Anaerolineae bacterium]|mgnify:CR=1 FL=1|jgi:hypothetical protein|nr:hypothetical protein [Anaerolineae bacterium]MBT7325479.1 hypothetical protein [Anaerolineae bacterium]
MKEKLLSATAIIVILAALIGSLTWVNYLVAPQFSGGEELLVPWTAARAFLVEGNSPYALATAHKAQIAIYGQVAEAGEYPYHLDIPFYLLFLYFPFALIDNFDLARALWMSFAEIALFGIGFLCVYLTQWKTSRILSTLFYLSLLFGFYGLYPLIGGSGLIFTTLILLLCLVALREGWDEILGILLLFGTFRLQNGGLLFLLILFWLFITKRWRVFAIALMSLSVLFIISYMLLPDWFMPFLRSTLANLRAEQGFLFSEFLQIWQPDRGNLIAQILRWSVVVALFIEWRAARGKDFPRLIWVAGLSLAFLPFLNLRVSPLSYSALFLPLALVFKIAENRWGKRARWGIGLILTLLLGAWGLFSRFENALQILAYILPAFLVLALYWLRWWFIRPPRTWVDETAKLYK